MFPNQFEQTAAYTADAPFAPDTGYAATSMGVAVWGTSGMSIWDEIDEEDEFEADDFEAFLPQPYTAEFAPAALSPDRLMLLIMTAVSILICLFSTWAILRHMPSSQTAAVPIAPVAPAMPSSVQTAVATSGGQIADFFSPSVLYWEEKILEWAVAHQLDPNMVATVMQIESCGLPSAVSGAGAQGLFQVMPYHFEAGEEMLDPDTNAQRGMNFLAELLLRFDGDASLAFAGYNGGPGNAVKSWQEWPAETQRYYIWSTGIYAEAQAGDLDSPTLQSWLEAGGSHLCARAAAELGFP